MSSLPIRRMVLYKHGVGYFERRGLHSGETLSLNFPLPAMDDVLKSLVVIDRIGQVRNVDFATPEDRAALIARGSIHLSPKRSLLNLLRDLRGRQARLVLSGKPAETVAGLVIGIDVEKEEPLRRAIVSLFLPEEQAVRPIPLEDIRRVELLDEAARTDLAFFLRAAQSDQRNRAATIHLTPGDHDLLVGYVAPAPAWRVSYRLLVESADDGATRCFLQGWGLFDNQLEEDLVDVEVTLVAGRPISFRYQLYEPQTPNRPLIQDAQPAISFLASSPEPAAAPPGLRKSRRAMALRVEPYGEDDELDALAASAPPEVTTEERGALFAYRVTQPVSVGRGQSAMAPIVGVELSGQRELVYNRQRMSTYPLAGLRIRNETGLTLERGPATVIVDGEYAGESVLPFTRAGAEFSVFHAVELGVTVDETTRREQRVAGLRLNAGDLIIDEYLLIFQHYQIASALAEPCVVIVEHPRIAHTTLVDTPPPQSDDGRLARWAVAVPAFGRAELVVCERQILSRRQTISSLTGEQLQEWLRDQVLDRVTAQRLASVLNLLRQIDAAQRAIDEATKERQRVFERQQRLQQQIAPLRSDGDEGSLRQRYVATLAQLEDRVDQIEAEIAAQQATIQRLKSQIEKRLRQMKAEGVEPAP